jgi:DNA-binding transcriptional LysR family regulator
MGPADADPGSLDLAQLTSFVALADSGNLGRASKALHVAHARAEQARPEARAQARLFVRSARGMTLAPRGEVFLPHARAVVREMHAAHAAVRAF